MEEQNPSDALATHIAHEFTSEEIRSVRRFPTGLRSDTDAEIPYVLLERLEGSDLGDLYSKLSSAEKRGIASADPYGIDEFRGRARLHRLLV